MPRTLVALAVGAIFFSMVGHAQAAAFTKTGSSPLNGRTLELCGVDARNNAIVDAMMDAAVNDLRLNAETVRPIVRSLAGVRSVVKRTNAKKPSPVGENCEIVVRVFIDEIELYKQIKRGQGKTFDAACIPEVGVVVKVFYKPMNGDGKEASNFGFGAEEGTLAMVSALLSQDVKMVSLNRALDVFLNNQKGAFETLGGDGLPDGLQEGTDAEVRRYLDESLEKLLKRTPQLRRPGFLVVSARIYLTERGINNFGEYEIEASAAMQANAVEASRATDLASLFRMVSGGTTYPGPPVSASSYKAAARLAVIRLSEGLAGTIASDFLKDISRKMATMRSYQLILENARSEMKQVRPMADAFAAVGMCGIERISSDGDRKIYKAEMPAEKAEQLVIAVLDIVKAEPAFAGTKFEFDGKDFTIILP